MAHGSRGLVHHSRAWWLNSSRQWKDAPKTTHIVKDQETKQGKQEPGLGSLQRSPTGDLLPVASPYLPKVPQPPKISLPGIKPSKHEPLGIFETNQSRALDILNVSISIWQYFVPSMGTCERNMWVLSIFTEPMLSLGAQIHPATHTVSFNGRTSWADGQCRTSHHRGWIRLLDYTLIHYPNGVLVF